MAPNVTSWGEAKIFRGHQDMRILSHSLVAQPESHPKRWVAVLHGAFGSGRNWASVARHLTRERPELGVLLVDLRMHGASQGFPPPHTLEACAADLLSLVAFLSIRVTATVGHSFGGKVALVHCNHRPQDVDQVWVVDSSPSAAGPSGDAWRMLTTVRSLPAEFSAREDAIADLMRSGFARNVAEWMAQNLERRDGLYGWRLDFAALEAVLRDYFSADLWNIAENPPPPVEVHFVKATESNVLDEQDVSRLDRAQHSNSRVRLHTIAGGHWLNTDNPNEVVSLLSKYLR